MKSYLVLITGGEGCDYSIGCGYKPMRVRAESEEQALETAIQRFVGGGSAEEVAAFFNDERVTGAQIYEVTSYNDTLFDEIHKRVVEKIKEDDKRRDDEAEQAEYERLKRKYNP